MTQDNSKICLPDPHPITCGGFTLGGRQGGKKPHHPQKEVGCAWSALAVQLATKGEKKPKTTQSGMAGEGRNSIQQGGWVMAM